MERMDVLVPSFIMELMAPCRRRWACHMQLKQPGRRWATRFQRRGCKVGATVVHERLSCSEGQAVTGGCTSAAAESFMNWTAQCARKTRGVRYGVDWSCTSVQSPQRKVNWTEKKCLSQAPQDCPAARLHIEHCGNQHDGTSFRLVEFVASSLHHGRPDSLSLGACCRATCKGWAKQQIMPLAKVAFIPTKPCMAP